MLLVDGINKAAIILFNAGLWATRAEPLTVSDCTIPGMTSHSCLSANISSKRSSERLWWVRNCSWA